MTDSTDQLDPTTLQVPDDQVLNPIADSLTSADLDKIRDLAQYGDTEPAAYATPDKQMENLVSGAFRAESVALISVPKITSTAAVMAANAVKWAATKVGAKESPAWSNHIFAWEDVKPAWQGEPWCAAFVVDAWARQGVDLRKFLSNPYYCPNLEAYAKAQGVWHAYGSKWDPSAGDISIMGRSLATHTGLAAPAAGAYSGYRQIEGNTVGENSSGSQTNGDGVYIRFRGDFIRGWIDMSALIAKLQAAGKLAKPSSSTAPSKPSTPVTTKPRISFAVTAQFWGDVLHGGKKGAKCGQKNGNVAAMQRELHRMSETAFCPLTSVWDKGTQNAYGRYQRAIGYTGSDADGVPGFDSWARLMKRLYTPVK